MTSDKWKHFLAKITIYSECYWFRLFFKKSFNGFWMQSDEYTVYSDLYLHHIYKHICIIQTYTTTVCSLHIAGAKSVTCSYWCFTWPDLADALASVDAKASSVVLCSENEVHAPVASQSSDIFIPAHIRLNKCQLFHFIQNQTHNF